MQPDIAAHAPTCPTIPPTQLATTDGHRPGKSGVNVCPLAAPKVRSKAFHLRRLRLPTAPMLLATNHANLDSCCCCSTCYYNCNVDCCGCSDCKCCHCCCDCCDCCCNCCQLQEIACLPACVLLPRLSHHLCLCQVPHDDVCVSKAGCGDGLLVAVLAMDDAGVRPA